MGELSCMDCGAMNCRKIGAEYTEFCATAKLKEGELEEALKILEEPVNYQVLMAAAQVMRIGRGNICRIQETILFAREIKVKKIGIATCVGLMNESRILTRILRAHGFEVFGIACKVGAVRMTDMGIDEECCVIGPNICNPVLQAKLLNEAKTDLNIVVGLCVGHDSIFYRYSQALCTTLITKDRATGNNAAAPLYTVNSSYKKLLNTDFKMSEAK